MNPDSTNWNHCFLIENIVDQKNELVRRDPRSRLYVVFLGKKWLHLLSSGYGVTHRLTVHQRILQISEVSGVCIADWDDSWSVQVVPFVLEDK